MKPHTQSFAGDAPLNRVRSIAASLVLSLFIPTSATNAAPFVPSGLNAGDMYHLAFVTRESREATSGNISDYNAFVQAQAELNPTLTGTDMGVMWKAIASTEDDDARGNAVVSAPVYLFDSTLISTPGDTLHAGFLSSSLDIDQFGNQFLTFPITGSEPTGVSHEFFPLGNPDRVTRGFSGTPTQQWLAASTQNSEIGGSFYALSERLTVPVPEPSTAVLTVLGLISLARFGRARSKS